jgi:hypothetical protein
MTSALPAVRLSTVGSSFVPRESSTDGTGTLAAGASAAGDTMFDRHLRVDVPCTPLPLQSFDPDYYLSDPVRARSERCVI